MGMRKKNETRNASAGLRPATPDLKKPPLVVLVNAGAAIFLLAAIFFQPFSFRVPFGGEVQGWVFILSQYPWPADHVSAISCEYARWPFWGGQVFVGLVFAAMAEQMESRYRNS
jgi:hypothetical protein